MRFVSLCRTSTLMLAVIGILSPAWAAAPATIEIPTRSHAKVAVETINAVVDGGLLAIDQQAGVSLSNHAILPLDRVLTIRFSERLPAAAAAAAAAAAGRLKLVDGTTLSYQACEIREGTLTLRLAGDSMASVSLDSVVAWQLDSSASDETPEALEDETSDVLFVKRRSQRGLTPVEGVVLGVTDQSVRFAIGSAADNATDEEPVEVPWERLGGVHFFRPPATATPSVVINLLDGGRLAVETMSLEDEGLVWDSPVGSGRIGIGAIQSIDCSAGRVTPVAELRLLAHSWKPYFGVATHGVGHAFDRSLADEPIRLRCVDPRSPEGWPAISMTREHTHGVAMRSQAELRFALPAGAERLKGWIGLDPQAARAGSAEVVVLAGAKTIWSGTVDGKTRPIEINSPTSGEATLTLRVGYGDNLDSGDRVHFADLRVIQ